MLDRCLQIKLAAESQVHTQENVQRVGLLPLTGWRADPLCNNRVHNFSTVLSVETVQFTHTQQILVNSLRTTDIQTGYCRINCGSKGFNLFRDKPGTGKVKQ